MKALKNLYKLILAFLVLFVFVLAKPNITSKEKEDKLIPEITRVDIDNKILISKTLDNLISYFYGISYYTKLKDDNYVLKTIKTLIYINEYRKETAKIQLENANNNYESNKLLDDPNDYIIGQYYYDDFKFGTGDVGSYGCGAIALYNLFYTLGKKINFSDVIYEIEQNRGIVLSGILGVDPTYIPFYLNNHDIDYQISYSFDELNNLNEDKYIILCSFNSDSLSDGAHYVFINYKNGKYIVYNMYSNSKNIYTFDDIKDVTDGKMIVSFII